MAGSSLPAVRMPNPAVTGHVKLSNIKITSDRIYFMRLTAAAYASGLARAAAVKGFRPEFAAINWPGFLFRALRCETNPHP
ncbi:hypothetical protein SDC9_180525 [bioreactor metagenome]|uniref:Uncharacterized protein n=1 Tax=bioreactor metagenome TaxID=1076179 RepID=A0A645H3Z4_9ZZZZ